jgi:hypothetical protein
MDHGRPGSRRCLFHCGHVPWEPIQPFPGPHLRPSEGSVSWFEKFPTFHAIASVSRGDETTEWAHSLRGELPFAWSDPGDFIVNAQMTPARCGREQQIEDVQA